MACRATRRRGIFGTPGWSK